MDGEGVGVLLFAPEQLELELELRAVELIEELRS
mgnify:CR=1 FL=1